jgi:hypothetical protein
MPARNRFTIFDALEASGAFASNPANAGSRDADGNALYVGPVEFPKMFYHPEGKTRITVQAEIITTPLGPKAVGEQREIISKVAANAAEAKRLLAEGWHDHPAKAMEAAGLEPPPMGSDQTIARLEAELAKARAQLAARNAPAPTA